MCFRLVVGVDRQTVGLLSRIVAPFLFCSCVFPVFIFFFIHPFFLFVTLYAKILGTENKPSRSPALATATAAAA